MGYAVNHGFDVRIDKELFRKRIGGKSYKRFWSDMVAKWDLDLGYTTFMNLLDNKIPWKLVYAYPLAQDCNMQIEDLFVYVKVEKRDDFQKVRKRSESRNE